MKIHYTFSATLILVAMMFAMNGCGSDNNEESISKESSIALTEAQFASDKTLKASAENIVVLQLEHLGATVDVNDTHTAGTDCYPFLHDEVIQTVLSVDANNSIGSLTVINKTTSESVTALSGEESESFELAANTEHEVCVTHHGLTEANQTVFIRFTDTTELRYDPDDLSRLLATNDCIGCDLSYADLDSANLHYTDLSYADLSHALLSYALLNYANMRNANLSNAMLSNAYLNHAMLDLTDLSNAYLLFTDLSDAYLRGANLSGANLSGATWTDGSICQDGSIGECIK